MAIAWRGQEPVSHRHWLIATSNPYMRSQSAIKKAAALFFVEITEAFH
jgi:hypothetical protein